MDFTLKSTAFHDGVEVGAYPASAQAGRQLTGPPLGDPDDTATAADFEVAFSGLSEGTAYYAVGEVADGVYRYIQFITDTIIPPDAATIIVSDNDEVETSAGKIIFPPDSLTDNEDGSVTVAFTSAAEVTALQDLLANNGKGVVVHGDNASALRPAGIASVEWHGSVEPANAVANDTWIVEEGE